MANSNTSLNGYEFGRSPRTTTPFWGGGSEGAAIDDTGIYTDKTWSSKKISDELAEKADADDVYTKAEVDELLEDIPSVDAYTKTETDELLAGKASVTSVYTKSQTYTKTEVDNLLSQIPSVDAYTKAQTDSLLDTKANAADVYTKAQVDNLIPDVSGLATKTELNRGLADCAKSTSVYTKAQTYTKTEVDNLISGVTPTPVDAYTKAQTDALLDEKANAADVYTKTQTVNLLADKADTSSVYTKTQTDNLLADKANASDVYTKTQTDNLLADKANSSDVYSKSQTYTKTEVDDLISQAGGGGAEIDDTTPALDKVWSSDKTRSSILKAAGLTLSNGVPATSVALVRQKISGSATSIRNAMMEQFSADYQYSLSGGTVTVTIMYENGGAGQSYTINLTDIPWNDVASADYSTNYPSDNSRWKTIVASEDIFEICIGGNVSVTTGYYYPYIFVRVPKGTYASSIYLSANLGNNTWAKAGSVAVINGYATDPTSPIFTYDATTNVTNSVAADTVLTSALDALIVAFKRSPQSIHKINKFIVENTYTDFNGNTVDHKIVFDIKKLYTSLPYSIAENVDITGFMAIHDALEYKSGNTLWIYERSSSSNHSLTKVLESVPTTNGNITGSRSTDSSTTIDSILYGYRQSTGNWYIKFFV